MAENVVSEKELKLLEIIKEKDERVEQLEKALNAKEVLIQSLQEKLRQFRVDTEPKHVDVQNSNETGLKIMKGEEESAQVTQPQNQVDSEISTVEAVVIAPEVLLEILKNMKTQDLLENCRLVSREWRDLSTEVLLKRTTFQIKFSSSRREFVVGRKYEFPQKLGELTDFLTTSKSFPCAHFIFDGNVKKDDAQAFLSHFGSHVKGLKLIGEQNLSCIRNLLVEQIPHLETLQLSRFREESLVPFVVPPLPGVPQILPRLFLEDSPAPQLPFLTSLKLGEWNLACLVQEILDVAPNLQACFGISSSEQVTKLRSRSHVIKGLKIKLEKDSGAITVGDLYNMMPILRQLHLTSLKVDYSSHYFRRLAGEDASFCSMISEILMLSQGSLKTLKLAPNPDFESLIEWPQLENVGKLTLSRDLPRDFFRLFTPLESDVETGIGLGVSKIFPNLHTIQLKFIRINNEDLEIFKDHPQISTVKSLEICRPSPQIVELFLPLFPNIKHIVLDKTIDFFDLAPIIWQIKGLKSLEIEFDCVASEIDAGFTGMNQRNSRLLRTRRNRLSVYEMEWAKKYKVQPSILEATELEQLFLAKGFNTSEAYNAEDIKEEDEYTRATCISFEYAFYLMPKLRVFPHRDL